LRLFRGIKINHDETVNRPSRELPIGNVLFSEQLANGFDGLICFGSDRIVSHNLELEKDSALQIQPQMNTFLHLRHARRKASEQIYRQ
jgi:hypothetical protein